MSTQTQAPNLLDPNALANRLVDPARRQETLDAGNALVTQAEQFTIESEEEYELSLTIAQKAIDKEKAFKAWIGPAKKLAAMLHTLLCAMENEGTAPLQKVVTIVKAERQRWRAKKEAEDRERERLASAAAKENQVNAAVETAAALEREGEKEAAEVIVEQALAAPMPAVVLQSSVPKQAGSSVKKKFSYRVDDPAKVQREYCSPDPKKMKQRVDAYGMEANIAGVTVYPDETEAIGGTKKAKQ